MTIRNPVELKIQRKLTREMINCDPTLIVLIRPHRDSDPTTGGVANSEETVYADLSVRLLYGYVGRRGRMNEPNNETLQRTPYSKDTLLAEHWADVQRGDTFDVDGLTYRVTYVYENKEYETVANIENTGRPLEE